MPPSLTGAAREMPIDMSLKSSVSDSVEASRTRMSAHLRKIGVHVLADSVSSTIMLSSRRVKSLLLVAVEEMATDSARWKSVKISV